jgi:ABC-type glycerol-3-phosphate transport system permease component
VTIFVKTLDKAVVSRIVRFVLWIWNDLLIAFVYVGTTEEVAVSPARLSEFVCTLLRRSFVRGPVSWAVNG